MTAIPTPEWTQTTDGQALLAALDASEGRTRLVGGAVRDALLGIGGNDIDLATEFPPKEVVRRLEAADLKAVPTGLSHGTVTAIAGPLVAEVTTLRQDVATDGRHANVSFLSDWREDAARRDFTINAMNARLPESTVEDYFGGLEDLRAGRVRFIGDPIARIAEDHLRILRFFRFSLRFGMAGLDADALAACRQRANDLMALSRERIAMELTRMLGHPDPTPIFAIMISEGIWAPVIPEFDAAAIDRLARLVEREAAAGAAPEPMRRLAALSPNAEAADSIARRLRLSKAQRQRAVAARSCNLATFRNILVAAHFEGVETARDCLLLADEWDEGSWQQLQGWTPISLPVSGRHLIAKGVPAGPDVSRLLAIFERKWAEAGFPQDTDTLDALLAEVAKL